MRKVLRIVAAGLAMMGVVGAAGIECGTFDSHMGATFDFTQLNR
jgi:hypothetical protein